MAPAEVEEGGAGGGGSGNVGVPDELDLLLSRSFNCC